VCPEHRQLGVSRVGHLAGEALVEHAAERVHVSAAVGFSPDLLRRDVGRSADRQSAGAGDSFGCEAPAQAEIGQIDVLVLVEQRVRRLDVPMDETTSVGGVERGGDLAADRNGPVWLQRPLLLQQCPEPPTFDQPHREEELPVDLAGVVDRDDVGMLERGRQLGLNQEAVPEGPVPGKLRGDQLHCNVSLESRVVSPVDDAHPAATKERLDLVPEQRRPDTGVCGNGHRVLQLRWTIRRSGAEVESPFVASNPRARRGGLANSE
jgi:hypothetical protein